MAHTGGNAASRASRYLSRSRDVESSSAPGLAQTTDVSSTPMSGSRLRIPPGVNNVAICSKSDSGTLLNPRKSNRRRYSLFVAPGWHVTGLTLFLQNALAASGGCPSPSPSLCGGGPSTSENASAVATLAGAMGSCTVVVLGFAVSPRGRCPASAEKRAYTDAGDFGSLSFEHSRHDARVTTRVIDHDDVWPISCALGPIAASEARSMPPMECPMPAKSPLLHTSAMYSHDVNKSSLSNVSKSHKPNPTDRIAGTSMMAPSSTPMRSM
mmetsp:Transcript_141/g.528  ORF Transcript_141/g.528 Transcript_141/m.528 type:complete len:268 (+) Transcript_141:315-1118(+)